MTMLSHLSIGQKKITPKTRLILVTSMIVSLWSAAHTNKAVAQTLLVEHPTTPTTVMGTSTLTLKNHRTIAATTKLTNKALPAETLEDDAQEAAANPLPNDRYASDQWNFMSQQVYPGAANIFNIPEHNGTQTQVVVAVVDSGVLLDHEDYRTLPGYDFVHDPAIGNDGDGRDSDPTDSGDWVSATDISINEVGPNCKIANSKWHGTAISGLIGAISENQLGVSGAASFASLLPVRVTGKCGGYVNDLIDGIRWSAGLSVSGAPDNPNPARIINLSIGFPGNCSLRLQSAIDEATRAGAILVTAATNSAVSLDTTPFSPATCKNVLAIGAVLRNGLLADYSAYGTDIFLLGPGGSASDGIVSTDNAGQQQANPESDYGYHFGTSFAAAHVSAALATLLSIDPALDNDSLKSLLSRSASSATDDPNCDSESCGNGRLNTGLAVNMLLDPALVPAQDQASTNDALVTGAAQPSETIALGSFSPGTLWVLIVMIALRVRQRKIHIPANA